MADSRARYLRAHATDAERILWHELRILKVKGLHFRRQAPLGRYYVDFVCHSVKIVVEIDGAQHTEPARVVHDAERTAFLLSQGYRVLRFWNGEMMRSPAGVLDVIFAAISLPPPEICSRYSLSNQREEYERALANFDLPTRGR